PKGGSLVQGIEYDIAASSVVVAFCKFTCRVVDNNGFSWFSPCDLQQEMMNCLTLTRSWITQHHHAFDLVLAWNPKPGRPVVIPKVVSKTLGQGRRQTLSRCESSL